MRKSAVRVGLLLAVLACVASLASSASAQIPDVCLSGRNRRLYDLGFAKGQSLARQAFNSTAVAADCDNYELFRDKVIAALGTIVVPPNPPVSTLCQFRGSSDGMLDQVATIQDQCIGTCIVDGAFAGEVAAKLYCELSIQLHGLGLDAITFVPQVVGLCGENFEASCFAIFDETAEQDVPGCAPFTVTPFKDVYDQTSNNQCLYDPLIPELP